jgi:phosphomannomutase/phosphoglucomutase
MWFSRASLRERPGAAIIGDVKCSNRTYDDIVSHGSRPIMSMNADQVSLRLAKNL